MKYWIYLQETRDTTHIETMIKQIAIAGIFLAVSQCGKIRIDQPEITQDELKQHIRVLSSDELSGRLPGTPGDEKAASYIRAHFKGFGLSLPAENGYQTFEVTTKVIAGKNNAYRHEQYTARPLDDFMPLGFSAKAELTAGVVFAGYGFQVKTDSVVWDDYKNIDPKGKWCMILRGSPEIKGADRFSSASQDRDKAMLAKDMGAAGVLLVSGPAYDKNDELVSLSYKEGSLGIPVIQIRRPLADELLKSSGKSILSLEEEIKKNVQPASFATGETLYASADVKPETVKTHNILGLLQGNDPVLKNQYIIIGAHYDHLGMGGMGSGSRVPDTIAVHHGADDNASGVAALIELAEKFAAHKADLKRSILFIAFSAEEEGLLGSKYFTDHPVIDLKNVDAMINLDMIGRLKENHSLQINGVGTSLEATGIVNEFNADSAFRLTLSPEGYGPSDHSSFYAKNIPVIYLTTGAHVDYHTPRDNYEGINFAGLKEVADYVYKIANEIDHEPNRLTFREAGPKTQESGRMKLKVTLGIMPDFTSTENNGLRADFVTPGKPAAKAGMLKGDRIISVDGKPVNNIQDYMYRLSKLNHGETVNVEVIRNGKKELLIVQL